MKFPTRHFATACVMVGAVGVLTSCQRESIASSTTTAIPTTSMSAPPATPTKSTASTTGPADGAGSNSSTSVATPTSATATPPTDPPISPMPASGATVVPNQQAAITYDHPDLGPITITIASPAQDQMFEPEVRATVNATGKTVYEWTGTGGYAKFGFAGTELNPAIKDPVDGRGHVFFEWDPGRLDGISYLVPTTTGFDSNGTLAGSFYDGHYDAHLVDPDGDGTYEIEQSFQVCTDSCADGYSYSHVWTWDGSAYTGSDVDPNLSSEQVARLDAAEQAFTDFLLAAGAREYKKAWAMLTPSYQDAYGGFDKFASFWDGIDSVGTEQIHAYEVSSPSGVGLDVRMWFQLTDGSRQRETVAIVMNDGTPPKIAEYNASRLDN